MLTTIAWVTTEDIKAVRLDDGTERLVVDGLIIPLTDDDFHPTQQVINYCHANNRQRFALRAAWAKARLQP